MPSFELRQLVRRTVDQRAPAAPPILNSRHDGVDRGLAAERAAAADLDAIARAQRAFQARAATGDPALVEAVRGLTFPAGQVHAFIHGEATFVKAGMSPSLEAVSNALQAAAMAMQAADVAPMQLVM